MVDICAADINNRVRTGRRFKVDWCPELVEPHAAVAGEQDAGAVVTEPRLAGLRADVLGVGGG